MSRTSGSRGFTAVLLLLTACAGSAEYPTTSPLIEAIGLPGPRADTDRACQVVWRISPRPKVPTDEVACNGPTTAPGDRQLVLLRAGGRAFARAEHAWSLADSAQWQHAQDSVVAAWQARGATAVTCAHRPPDTVRRAEHWLLEGGLLRLLAYRRPAPRGMPNTAPVEWRLQLDALPDIRWCDLAAPV